MLLYDYAMIIIALYYYYTNFCDYESLKYLKINFLIKMTNIYIMVKISPRLKFGYYDTQIVLPYAVPSSYNHNQSLLVVKQRCFPSKVDNCCVML